MSDHQLHHVQPVSEALQDGEPALEPHQGQAQAPDLQEDAAPELRDDLAPLDDLVLIF